jgi:hypothetical protein
MAKYNFECTCFLGMSHCGSVTVDGEGFVELTDEEVAALVALIKEKGSSDVEEIGLEEALPEIYTKLDEAFYEAAFEAEKDHWLWEGYHDGYYEYDTYELMDHCELNCGFNFVYDQEQFLDEDGELDEYALEEAKLEAFEEWLDDYLIGLSKDECHSFFEEQMNAELECDGMGGEYEITIPPTIVEMAGGIQ